MAAGFIAIVLALTALWLGMVLAISFLEAPLKFRAPGVTTRIGLGIGRLVFRALNVVETVLLLGIVVTVANFGMFDTLIAEESFYGLLLLIAGVMLLVQLILIRPLLNRRTAAVLAGESPGGSKTHLVYIATELVKVVTLAWAVLLSIELLGTLSG